MGLVEGITDDTCVVVFIFFTYRTRRLLSSIPRRYDVVAGEKDAMVKHFVTDLLLQGHVDFAPVLLTMLDLYRPIFGPESK